MKFEYRIRQSWIYNTKYNHLKVELHSRNGSSITGCHIKCTWIDGDIPNQYPGFNSSSLVMDYIGVNNLDFLPIERFQ